MSKADEMFEELGYEKEETTNTIVYKKEYNTHIAIVEFELYTKLINFIAKFKDDNFDKISQGFMCLSANAQKIKAINEKVKELGWYD